MNVTTREKKIIEKEMSKFLDNVVDKIKKPIELQYKYALYNNPPTKRKKNCKKK